MNYMAEHVIKGIHTKISTQKFFLIVSKCLFKNLLFLYHLKTAFAENNGTLAIIGNERNKLKSAGTA